MASKQYVKKKNTFLNEQNELAMLPDCALLNIIRLVR